MKPKEVKGVEDEAQGYYVEIRPIESLEWSRCNSVPITLTSYTVLGLKAMATYWVRVLATNYGGDGEPQGFDKYIIAMPPPGRKHSLLQLLFVKMFGVCPTIFQKFLLL